VSVETKHVKKLLNELSGEFLSEQSQVPDGTWQSEIEEGVKLPDQRIKQF